MKKVTEIFKSKDRTFSFELFPTKTEQGHTKLLETIKELVTLKPDFISCTYGAGGGSRERTFEIVRHIQDNYGIVSIAHLTCVMHTTAEIKTILTDIQKHGIANVLALRGDAPKEFPDWKPGKDNFVYSYELCQFIRQNFADYFAVGVAGFPEGHILCPDRDLDARYLKNKIAAGADFVITQLFFNNKDYFDYVKRLRALGVTARVIPGILPITNYDSLLRFCQSCGTNVTAEVKNIFEPIREDAEKTLREGIAFAIRQCKELLAGGAPGLHFYALNKFHPVADIWSEVVLE